MREKIQGIISARFSKIIGEPEANRKWMRILQDNRIATKELHERPKESKSDVVAFDPARPGYLVIPVDMAIKIISLGVLP